MVSKKELAARIEVLDQRYTNLEYRCSKMADKIRSLEILHGREPMTHATFTVTTREAPEETTISTETRPETEEEISTRVGHDHREK